MANKKTGRVVTGHAGLQVSEAATAFSHWVKEQAKQNPDTDALLPYQYMAHKLKDIPVFMGNTASDIVISLNEANSFYNELVNSGHALRSQFLVPRSKMVLHDAIGVRKNPLLGELQNSIADFMRKIELDR